MLWEKYGIELHFPSSSAVHIEGTVSVISTDDGNYIFPEGSELVSAVYEVSANESFPEPVTVRLEHCVPIVSEKEASAMSFAIADTAQGPPYEFHPQNGGIFRSGSSYADIELTHFSLLVVAAWGWSTGLFCRPIPFSARVYYLQNSMASFVVTKNLAAHTNVSYYYFLVSCSILYTALPFRLSKTPSKQLAKIGFQ